jgi:hypothetical protein
MAENYSVVDFSGLSATSDGNTLLYADNKVCKSDKTLGQLIDGKIDGKGYATETFVTGEIDRLSGTVSTEYATKEELGKVGNFIVTAGDEDSKPNLNPSVAETKSIYLVKDENAASPDQYREWIVTENEQEEKVWTCIGDTTMDLSDYALSADVNAELALKEDKVFVAEYNVTTYADIKNAYDAGKQIICKFYEDKERWPEFVRLLRLSEYLPMGNCFYFDAQTNDTANIYVSCGYYNDDTHWTHSNNGFYKRTETSGSEQLTDAFNTKQNKLTFAGENNTITAINTSAVGGGGDLPTINLNDNYYLSLDKICAKKVEHSENGSEYEEISLPNYHWTTTKNTQNNLIKINFNKAISNYTSIILTISAYVQGPSPNIRPVEKELKGKSIGDTIATMYYGDNVILKELSTDYIVLEFTTTSNSAYFDIYGIKTTPEDIGIYKFSTTDINCSNNVINNGSHIVGNGITGCSALSGSCIEGLNNIDCSARFGSHIEGSANSNCSATTGSIIYGAECKLNKAVDGSIIGGLRVSANTAVGGSFIIGGSNSGNITVGAGDFILGYGIKDCSARDGSIINGLHISSTSAYRGSYIEGNSHKNNYMDFGAHIEGSNNHNNKLSGTHLEGVTNTDNSGVYSHIEGHYNSAISAETGAHIEGYMNSDNTAKTGAHIEGYGNSSCTAFNGGHIEGVFNYSNRFDSSHIEGYRNSGCNISEGSHLEGLYNKDCTAFYGSHIEGIYNITPAATTGVSAIHLGGGYNAATNDFETVIGKYCNYSSISANKPLLVVGNGSTDAARSNAVVVYENGGLLVAGNITANGTPIISLPSTQTASSGDVLTFDGTTIGWVSAQGGGGSYTSGTGIKIANDIISINTNGTAAGTMSFVEGNGTTANGSYSHAEGWNTTVNKNANAAHAEGYKTWAGVSYSHAEGQDTQALGYASHAEGMSTIAASNGMHAGGTFNKTSADVLFVIGNGINESNRSDAFVVATNGLASATNLATSSFTDVDAALTTLSSDIGNIETILQSI